MRILLHICCANCGIYPWKALKGGNEVTGFWFNPNIHPYQEYKRRLDVLKDYSIKVGLEVIYKDEYGLKDFLRAVINREDGRCPICYRMRLCRTAEEAKRQGFDGFTTTLLVSPHQDHEAIRKVGDEVGKEKGIHFYYQDFRGGFREAMNISRETGLYRQNYCGCIYSEYERFKGKEE